MRLFYGTISLIRPTRWLLCLLSLALFPAFTHDPVYSDIYRQETDLAIIFGNSHLEVQVDKRTGAWTVWTDKSATPSLITPDTTRPALDFSINGSYLLAKHGGTLLRNETTIDKDRQGVVLSVTVGILPQ